MSVPRIHQEELAVATSGRGTTELTAELAAVVARSGVGTGLCQAFLQHTSASLILCENADPAVRRDLEDFMGRLVRDGDPRFTHRSEGPDDMAAHVRSLLAGVDLLLPVRGGRLALGTWQGVYLWEHRHRGQRRRVVVTVQGLP